MEKKLAVTVGAWLVTSLLLVKSTGCPQPPNPPPGVPDADIPECSVPLEKCPKCVCDAGADAASEPVDPVHAACLNLRAIGCVEGNLECDMVLARIVEDRLTPVDLKCLAGAVGKAGARACGATIKCP